MPGRDGTGPLGKGPVLGRGTGRGGQRGPMGAGPTVVGMPCTSMKCPKCGTAMIRDS